jgi:hypothetical protein
MEASNYRYGKKGPTREKGANGQTLAIFYQKLKEF